MSASGQDESEPEGYRTDDYRAPTPATLRGARVVTTAEAEQIWKAGGAIFVDVLPHAPRPAICRRERSGERSRGGHSGRRSWLPDTGYGALAAVTENYLRANLARVGGDPTKAIVVYCLRDAGCHGMRQSGSLALGSLNIVWYPDGTDGWAEAHLPLREFDA